MFQAQYLISQRSVTEAGRLDAGCLLLGADQFVKDVRLCFG